MNKKYTLEEMQQIVNAKENNQLTVIKQVGQRGGRWLCQCSCGKEVELYTAILINPAGVKSCGCGQRANGLRKSGNKELQKKAYTTRLERNTRRTTNKSGVPGVCFVNRDQLWLASITVNYKCIYLGMYRNKEDAIAARKQAEAVYVKPRIKKLKKNLKKV